jgi:hypothetical protein
MWINQQKSTSTLRLAYIYLVLRLSFADVLTENGLKDIARSLKSFFISLENGKRGFYTTLKVL